jgi:hypothetical protein
MSTLNMPSATLVGQIPKACGRRTGAPTTGRVADREAGGQRPDPD